MTDYTELQAELEAKKAAGWQCTDGLSIDTVLALIAENDRLAAQVSTLQANANSWQSGYDEGRRVGTKTALAERDQLKAENEALRKRIEDLSPFKGAPLTGPSLKCLACGGYHNGMQGLPCPNMRITAQAELPETRSGQIGAALSKGEQP
ncbi:hypothetical protein ACIPI6_15015 [Pseudomonas protegens]|uniref:hypothetical protein n=1 Tax=Pseudomonas protegens TaxID=380021 RepID=UPI00380EA1CE